MVYVFYVYLSNNAILGYKGEALNAFKKVDDDLTAYKQDYIILTATQRKHY